VRHLTLVCPHRPPCPGCPRLDEDDVPRTRVALLELLCRDAGAPPPVTVRGKSTAFRHRARLAVRGRVTSPKVGIFETGTHHVVDIPRCLVHHPLVNEVAAELRAAMVATRAPPYSDQAHRGLVRYMQVVVERPSQTAQVVVVTNGESPDAAKPLLAALRERLGAKLHSLFWNGNPERKNTILGPLWAKIAGPDAIEEIIGGAHVFYPPGAFGQSHLELADSIVETLHAWISPNLRVTELYAGVGPVGLGLAERSSIVRLNELAPDSVAGLVLGVAALPAEARNRTAVVAGPASEAVDWIAESDVIIADPPRKGLDEAVIAALAKDPPALFAYVSCGLESFMRDAAALFTSFALSELLVYDLFPHTDHVEVLARFERH
jgi:tRNA/tmRNA/rRNA uracil-C5-methylase (TrmA/RlmC/RlmD family)